MALTIGVLRETLAGEKRVGLTPDVTKKLTAQGNKVMVEAGAGTKAHFHDQLYLEAGAEIESNRSLISTCVRSTSPRRGSCGYAGKRYFNRNVVASTT